MFAYIVRFIGTLLSSQNKIWLFLDVLIYLVIHHLYWYLHMVNNCSMETISQVLSFKVKQYFLKTKLRWYNLVMS